MIVISGYNVYPQYIEKIIESHPAVDKCIVVAIPHPYKKQVPIANVVLHNSFIPSDELTRDIRSYCEKSIAKYAMPNKIEYIRSVPKTIIGKINYKYLEEENKKKYPFK